MNIYVSHSKEFDFKMELYEPILASSLVDRHNFILPHEQLNNPFPIRELLQNKGCDMIIAEVSFPSTGQGIELAWANELSVPIICIFKSGSIISGSLNAVTNKILMYTDTQNMIEGITGALKQYE